jgi:hypothetical protein
MKKQPQAVFGSLTVKIHEKIYENDIVFVLNVVQKFEQIRIFPKICRFYQKTIDTKTRVL